MNFIVFFDKDSTSRIYIFPRFVPRSSELSGFTYHKKILWSNHVKSKIIHLKLELKADDGEESPLVFGVRPVLQGVPEEEGHVLPFVHVPDTDV